MADKGSYAKRPNVRTGGKGSFQNFADKGNTKAPGHVVATKGSVGPMKPKTAPQFSKTAGAKKSLGSLV